jgi:hypothetical protein
MIELFRYFEQPNHGGGRRPEFLPASPAEIAQTYKRYHGLMTTYCGAVPEPSSTDKRMGYFTMWHKPVSFFTSHQQPLLEMELRSWQIPLPEGWTRDGDVPLVVPQDIGLHFDVSLRRFHDLFPFKQAHYHLEQDEILWDIGAGEPLAANTPVTSTDCEKMHLLADLFERAQSGHKLPGR